MATIESEEDGPLEFVLVNQMARDLGGVHSRTIKRRAKSDPDFPKLIVFGGRLHATRQSWEAYKKILLARGLEARPFPSKFPPEYSATLLQDSPRRRLTADNAVAHLRERLASLEKSD
jgi:hypothetical protein